MACIQPINNVLSFLQGSTSKYNGSYSMVHIRNAELNVHDFITSRHRQPRTFSVGNYPRGSIGIVIPNPKSPLYDYTSIVPTPVLFGRTYFFLDLHMMYSVVYEDSFKKIII